MSLVPSGRFMNWAPVTFTYASTTITLSGVTSVAPDNGASIISFAGDADHFMTTKVNDMTDPKFSVTCAGIGGANQLTPGLRGVFVATWRDSKNGIGTGGGAIVYTVSNAIVGGNSATGAFRQFGSATIDIECESADGTTSPVSITEL